MLQVPNQQSVQSCEQVKCLSSIPLDKCCLVVQMPSIEEMKREVADITCKMQSVYIDPKGDDNETKQLDCSDDGLIKENTKIPGNGHCSNNEMSKSNKQKADISNYQLERLKTSTFGSTPNTNIQCDKDDDYLLPTSPIKTSSQTLPREEQVFEEFVINGKRYRQVYQRRVVLERRTTRDVFFLPANNPDNDVNPPSSRCFEYMSPDYNDGKSSPLDELTKESLENRIRPGLDLTVLHPSNGCHDEENGITPAVVMRPIHEIYRSSKSNSLDRSNQCSINLSPKAMNSNSNLSGSENRIRTNEDLPVKRPMLDKCFQQSNSRTNCSKGKKLMRNFTDAIRRHIQCGVRRTKSNAKYDNVVVNKTFDEIRAEDKSEINGDVNNTLKDSKSPNNDTNSTESGSKEIVGYMYKFGVWDDQEPVLDPRLPRAISSPPNKNGFELDGTVIPTPPEWHHAEVGLEHTQSPNSPFIRGRTVACLQRFTQHSLTSGKPLHRSTYVQQTRLVRQCNRGATTKEFEKDQFASTKSDDLQTNEIQGSKSSLLTNSTLNTSKNECFELNSSNLTHNDQEPGWQLHTMDFKKCSHDRLQLLQSLCPSAAAAAILLGKQIHTSSALATESESAFEKLSSMEDLGKTNVLVTAKTWCPSTLLIKDPSPYLVFNTHGETNSPTGSSTPGLKHSPASTGLPEMSVRGGTLDALLIHTIHLLQMPSSDYPDCLLPDVIRVTHPTFTTSEKIIQRLIQFYIAYAPIEPGCQSSDWLDALTAVDYLVTIVQRLQPEQLSASLVLRLARFTRLLQLDAQLAVPKQKSDDTPTEQEQDTLKSAHNELADRLSSKLPVLSSMARLRLNSSEYPLNSNSQSQNQTHVHETDRQSSITRKTAIDQNDTASKLGNSSSLSASLEFDFKDEETESVIQRVQQFLASDPLSIAEELTRLEEEKFMQINFQELLNIQQLERGEAKSLGVCVEHFNKITKWARSLLFVLSPKLAEYKELSVKLSSDRLSKRQTQNSTLSPVWDKIPKRSSSHSRNSLECPNHLVENSDQAGFVRKNKNSDLDSNIFRQKSCYIRLPTVGSSSKTLPIREVACINSMFIHMCDILKQLAIFSAYMKPPNFAEYRRDLEAAELPCLPYLGLIFQQLIHLHAGNSIYLPEIFEYPPKHDAPIKRDIVEGSALTGAMSSSVVHPEKSINIWRCWKHYLILGYFIKREEGSLKSRHNIPINEKINQILNNFNDCFPDNVLDLAKDQIVSRLKTKRNFRS